MRPAAGERSSLRPDAACSPRIPAMDLQRLSTLSLPDASGTPRRLGDFWRERRVVLVFARHFG